MASSNFTYTQTKLSDTSYRLSILPTQENNDYGDLITSGTVTDGLTSKNFTLVHWGVPYIRQFGSSQYVSAAGGRLLYNVYTHYPFVFRSVPTWVHISDNLGHQIQEGQTIPASSAMTDSFLNTYFIDVDPNTGHSRDTYGTFNMGHYIGPDYSTLGDRKSWIVIEQEAGEETPEYIYFNPTAITFDATANTNDTKQVVVNSSSRWNGNLVLYDTNKFSISPDNGQSGETTVTVTYLGEHNESASYRTMLNIYAIDGTSGMWITKKNIQYPFSATIRSSSLELTGGTVDFTLTVDGMQEYIRSKVDPDAEGVCALMSFIPSNWVWSSYSRFYVNGVETVPPITLWDGNVYNIRVDVSMPADEGRVYKNYTGGVAFDFEWDGGNSYSGNEDTVPPLVVTISDASDTIETNATILGPASSAGTDSAYILKVRSTADWTISRYPRWVTISPLTGAASTSYTNVSINVSGNPGPSRSDFIQITAGTATPKVVSISQYANSNFIKVTPTAATYTSGLTRAGQLTVSASTDWRVVDKPSWVTFRSTTAMTSQTLTGGTSGETTVWLMVDANTGDTRNGSAAFALENTSYSGFWTVTQEAAATSEGTLHIVPEDDLTDITSMGGYYSILFENDDADAEDWLISYSDDWMQLYYDNQGNNPAEYIYAGQTTYLFLKVNQTAISRSGAVIFTGQATGIDITLNIEQTAE